MDTERKKAEHTPGPWKFEDEYVRVEIGEDKGEPIADPYCRPTSETNPGEMEANARLIASAPELLEALGSAVSMLEGLGMDDGGNPDMDALRAAIAKAKGEK